MCCTLQESDNKAEGIEQEETIDEHPSSPGWFSFNVRLPFGNEYH